MKVIEVLIRASRRTLIPGLVFLRVLAVAPAFAELRLQPLPFDDPVPYWTGAVTLVQDPSNANQQFLVSSRHIVRRVNGTVITGAFLDMGPDLASEWGQQGYVIEAAFPANYGTSGRLYALWVNPSGNLVLSRFKRSVDPAFADPGSRFDLRWGGGAGQRYITMPAAYKTHGVSVRAHIAFGPDGYLYVGIEDGSFASIYTTPTVSSAAQEPNSRLGKIIRIDVNVPDSDSEGFTVPPDNPFVDGIRSARFQKSGHLAFAARSASPSTASAPVRPTRSSSPIQVTSGPIITISGRFPGA